MYLRGVFSGVMTLFVVTATARSENIKGPATAMPTVTDVEIPASSTPSTFSTVTVSVLKPRSPPAVRQSPLTRDDSKSAMATSLKTFNLMNNIRYKRTATTVDSSTTTYTSQITNFAHHKDCKPYPWVYWSIDLNGRKSLTSKTVYPCSGSSTSSYTVSTTTEVAEVTAEAAREIITESTSNPVLEESKESTSNPSTLSDAEATTLVTEPTSKTSTRDCKPTTLTYLTKLAGNNMLRRHRMQVRELDLTDMKATEPGFLRRLPPFVTKSHLGWNHSFYGGRAED